VNIAQLDIREVNPQGSDALTLLREAAKEARDLYPELHAPDAPWPTNPPTPALGVYLVSYESGQPVGMAAHRPIDAKTTEVRRMYVLRRIRRLGVARALLERLEDHARAAGFTHLVLETGNRQLPAMRLYETCGFTRIEPFGKYTDDPTSVCYGKFILSSHAGLPKNAG
jgi:putative acetyltransferase